MKNPYVRGYFIVSGVLFNILIGSCLAIALVGMLVAPASSAVKATTIDPTATVMPSPTKRPPTFTPVPTRTQLPPTKTPACAVEYMDTEYFYSAYLIITGPRAQELCDALAVQEPEPGIRVEQVSTWPTEPEWCAYISGDKRHTMHVVAEDALVGETICAGMDDVLLDTSTEG